ncbi:TfoX/Sxy family protein [Candidatus Nitrospira bockiana]
MADSTFKDFVLDQLKSLKDVSCRAMFGGYGLYRGRVFFGILHRDRLYLKTDRATRALFLQHGMKPFRPNKKQTLTRYYAVPLEVVEDPETLGVWADRASRCTED